MGLKSICYISESLSKTREGGVPSDFSVIHRQARINNKQNAISGLLTFCAGRYLQIVEGEAEAVDRLYSAIEKDQRHRVLAVIVNQFEQKRYFEDTSMRVVSFLNGCDEFDKYVDSHAGVIQNAPSYAQKLWCSFTKVDQASHSRKGFENKSLKLKSWPDFTRVKQTPVVLGLSAKLLSQSENYNALIKSGEFGTKAQVDKILRAFDLMGILEVAEFSADASAGRKHTSGSNGNAFYNKLKRFLGLR